MNGARPYNDQEPVQAICPVQDPQRLLSALQNGLPRLCCQTDLMLEQIRRDQRSVPADCSHEYQSKKKKRQRHQADGCSHTSGVLHALFIAQARVFPEEWHVGGIQSSQWLEFSGLETTKHNKHKNFWSLAFSLSISQLPPKRAVTPAFDGTTSSPKSPMKRSSASYLNPFCTMQTCLPATTRRSACMRGFVHRQIRRFVQRSRLRRLRHGFWSSDISLRKWAL